MLFVLLQCKDYVTFAESTPKKGQDKRKEKTSETVHTHVISKQTLTNAQAAIDEKKKEK